MSEKLAGYTKSMSVNNWIRENLRDPQTGLVITDIDFFVHDFKRGIFMFVEIKNYDTEVTYAQTKMFELIDKSIKDKGYQGFFVITFSNDGPDESATIRIRRLGGKTYEISKGLFQKFLEFNLTYEEVKYQATLPNDL